MYIIDTASVVFFIGTYLTYYLYTGNFRHKHNGKK